MWVGRIGTSASDRCEKWDDARLSEYLSFSNDSDAPLRTSWLY